MKTPPISLVAALCAFGVVSAAFGGPATYDSKAATTITRQTEGSLLDDYFRPSLELRYTYNFDLDFEDAAGQLSTNEAELFVPLPAVHNDQFVFLPQLYYRYEQMDIDTPGYHNSFDLHTIRVPLQAAWLSASSPWFVYAYAEPGISSDFNQVNEDSFDLSASLDVGYRFSPNFVIAVGAYYTRDYGRDLVLPSIGMLWKINDWWSVQVTPLQAATVFNIGEDWRVKLKAMAYGGRWTAENDGERQRISLSGGKVGVDVERRLFRRAWLSVGAGANVLGNLRVEDRPNQELFDRDLEPGLYLTGALRWEF